MEDLLRRAQKAESRCAPLRSIISLAHVSTRPRLGVIAAAGGALHLLDPTWRGLGEDCAGLARRVDAKCDSQGCKRGPQRSCQMLADQ